MNKCEMERQIASLKAENADLRRKMREMNKLSMEQFKRLQEAETNAQRYREELMEVIGG